MSASRRWIPVGVSGVLALGDRFRENDLETRLNRHKGNPWCVDRPFEVQTHRVALGIPFTNTNTPGAVFLRRA